MSGAQDVAAVEAIVAGSGSNFSRGMRILPPARRQAMHAIYAFCRQVDDIADEAGPIEAKRPRLDAWRHRIAALYEGHADDAVTRLLLRAIDAYRLRREDFLAVIDGMEMDAGAPIVAPDAATLDLYCDRVAAAVGRLSVRAFGDPSAEADVVAYHLGRALQLTNILRDVGEDAARGRLYLPREALEAAGIPAVPAAAAAHPGLPRVCRGVAAMARTHFTAAEAAMTRCDRHAMRPARLMGATYFALLQALERADWRDPTRRISLPTWRKMALLLRYAFA